MKDDHLKALQLKGSSMFEGGTTLYCNGLGGLGSVDMDPSLLGLLDNPNPIRGNNVLAQLKTMFLGFRNGPWYVDCINGIIYIHNSKFEDEPVSEYTFKAEPGEVLEVNISLKDKHTPKQSSTSLVDQYSKKVKALEMKNAQKAEDAYNASIDRDRKAGEVVSPYKVEEKETKPFWENNTLESDLKQIWENNEETMARKHAMDEADKRVNENVTKKLENAETRAEINFPQFETLWSNMTAAEKVVARMELEDSNNLYRDPETQKLYIVYSQDPAATGRGEEALSIYGKLGGESIWNVSGDKGIFSGHHIRFKLTETDAFKKGEAVSVFDAYRQNANTVWNLNIPTIGEHSSITGSNSYAGTLPTYYDYSIDYTGGGGIVGLLDFNQVQRLLQSEDPEIKNLYKQLDHQKELINNLMKGKKEKELVCTMKVVGKPSLTCYRNINVYNISKTYSGTWYIKTVTHVLTPQSGYTTNLEMTFVKKSTKHE